MSSIIDYSKRTLDELLVEEKKIKNNQYFSAFGIGFLFAVMAYGLVMNGFGVLYTVIPIGLGYLISKSSQKQKEMLKQIREEIKNRI